MRFHRLLQMCFLAITSSPISAAPAPRAVLIIGESDPSGGAPTTFSSTLQQTLDDATPHVAVYGETLDLSRFAGPTQEAILRTYLQEKYRDVRFGVIAAVGSSAFELASRWRAELWPGMPVVIAAIDEMSAARFTLDSATTGLIMRRTIKSMVSAARLLVPDLKGVAVLGGTLERDAYRRQYLQELPALAREVEVINLTGQPIAEQARRSATLPPNTAILYTSLFIDDAGTRYSSQDALAALAKVANRPIVTDVESLVGLGAVGGYALNNVSYGKEVATLVLRILDGTPVTAIPVSVSEFTKPVFDSRQLERWGVSESSLPPGSEVRFRPPTAWQQYQWQIILVAVALLGQSSLIAALLHQRRRRRLAEAETRQRAHELARMNRRALASEMSATIAHELGQPLTAILSNAEAAHDLLGEKSLDLKKIREIVSDIIEEDTRASDLISRVRKLLKRDDGKSESVDFNELVESALRLIHGEVVKRKINVETDLAADLPAIAGDPVQLQQVLLNLLINAMDAVGPKTPPRRLISISTRANGRYVEVDVTDTGNGIAADDQTRVFEPFFTTKEHGLGLGLSICSTIVKAHGGKLSIQNSDNGGATAVLSVPSAPAANGKLNPAVDSVRGAHPARSHGEVA